VFARVVARVYVHVLKWSSSAQSGYNGFRCDYIT